jgi:hypothetical protein
MIKPEPCDGIDLTRNVDELNDQELLVAREKFQEIGDQKFLKEYGMEAVKLINRLVGMIEQESKPSAYYKIKTLLGVF